MESKTPAQVGPRGSGTGTQPQTGSSLDDIIFDFYHPLEHVEFQCSECGSLFELDELVPKSGGYMMCPTCNQRGSNRFKILLDGEYLENPP